MYTFTHTNKIAPARLQNAGGRNPLYRSRLTLEGIADVIFPDLKGDARRSGSEELRKLLEDAEARLYPVASEFRKTRNNAGHPASLNPVHPADVHCNLLLFPATAKLIARLKAWIIGFYV